jgi:signal transduction histidine kinase
VEDISLHVLDIVENSIKAKATKVRIKIVEDTVRDVLSIRIEDNGQGMDREMLKHVFDPFFTTGHFKRVGLGLPLLKQSAEETGGTVTVKSVVGRGTRVTATFGYSHIDRRPLGDMQKTLAVLIAGNPGVHFVYEHEKDGLKYGLDTDQLRNAMRRQAVRSG